MRLDIRYVTSFRYGGPVVESQNELRACPASDGRQALLHYHVTTAPSSRLASYVDHWGTRVDTFGVRLPHGALEIVAEATVDTAPQPAPPRGGSLAALRAEEVRDRHLEFLLPSRHTRWGPQVAETAAQLAAAHDDAAGAVQAIHDAVADRVEYRPGATYVGVDVDEVFSAGRGVCQDFAHLTVAMLRAVGVPARYVSGYLFASDDATGAEVAGDEVLVQTHAWVEAALPTGQVDPRGHPLVVWWALDPTNRAPVGERHVTIGRGRDYDDVAPFRGVYAGPSDHELDVSVAMRRLAEGAAGGSWQAAQTQQ